MKVKNLRDYTFSEIINAPEWDYELMVGPKTMSTRTLMPIINISVDHDNKTVTFEYMAEEWEKGD